MNDIEKALIDKCKRGDVEAFEKLIFGYQKKVYNMCYRYFENYDDASEISQEIFIKIYKAISGFNEASSLSTWVYKITATTCIDELRKRKNINTVSIDDSQDEDSPRIEIADISSNPHDQLEAKEMKALLQYAISQLSEEYKTVVILRDIQGFSYDEISEFVGIPLGTVKSRIKRARNTLKDHLIKSGNFFSKKSSNEVKEG